jgi:hypothetical protein
MEMRKNRFVATAPEMRELDAMEVIDLHKKGDRWSTWAGAPFDVIIRWDGDGYASALTTEREAELIKFWVQLELSEGLE